MDYALPAPPPTPTLRLGVLAKSFNRFLRRSREPTAAENPKHFRSSGELYGKPTTAVGERQKEAEVLVANLFSGISAFKAAYVQLQLAQAPYDPDAIQSADNAIVTELKRLSDLKQNFLRNRLTDAAAAAPLAAEITEQRNLLKTYKNTIAKLETELRSKDSEVASLRAELRVAEQRQRALETRIRPSQTLAAIDDLHLSGVNPRNFLTLLRSTVKSIRSFVKVMVFKLDSAGWDLDAAAGAIQPDLRRCRNPNQIVFAFESYVSRVMFSDFQHKDFGIGGPVRDRQRFFEEFSELKFVKAKECFGRKTQFGKFCKGKYLGMVHPKMEASFFGGLEHRAVVSDGGRWPERDFFEGFAKMAKRVWLLHCLFFSFRSEEKGAIFEARRGSRFSEVFMESVAEEEEENAAAEGGGARLPVVGFTVMPGFRVGKTVIQCRVYLISCCN